MREQSSDPSGLTGIRLRQLYTSGLVERYCVLWRDNAHISADVFSVFADRSSKSTAHEVWFLEHSVQGAHVRWQFCGVRPMLQDDSSIEQQVFGLHISVVPGEKVRDVGLGWKASRPGQLSAGA